MSGMCPYESLRHWPWISSDWWVGVPATPSKTRLNHRSLLSPLLWTPLWGRSVLTLGKVSRFNFYWPYFLLLLKNQPRFIFFSNFEFNSLTYHGGVWQLMGYEWYQLTRILNSYSSYSYSVTKIQVPSILTVFLKTWSIGFVESF